jgi:hydroxyacylglutathione hydrolase
MTSPAWTHLDDGIHVRQSAAFQMNSTVLLRADHAILVDPGVLASEIDDLAAVVRQASPAEITLLFTHAHWDHVLGRSWWPQAGTVAHDRFHAVLVRDQVGTLAEIEALAAQHGEVWTRGFSPFRPAQAVSGLRYQPIGSWRLVLRDAPGHADTQLTVHLPDARVLIAADMLSDIEIPLLDGPCLPYRRTLLDLAPLAENGAIETLIPGHGTIARGRDAVVGRLRRDLDYLGRLEREVAAAHRAGRSMEAAREQLSGLEYGGAPLAGQSLADHLENVGQEYRALAGPPARR